MKSEKNQLVINLQIQLRTLSLIGVYASHVANRLANVIDHVVGPYNAQVLLQWPHACVELLECMRDGLDIVILSHCNIECFDNLGHLTNSTEHIHRRKERDFPLKRTE